MPGGLPPPEIRYRGRRRWSEPSPGGAAVRIDPGEPGYFADVPDLPPERPKAPPAQIPGSVLLDVARNQKGVIRFFPDGPEGSGRVVLVMMGNPRIHRPAHIGPDGARVEALMIKANTLVLWVDQRGVAELGDFSGVMGGQDQQPKPGGALPGSSASVIPEFLLGVYAEGAVELTFGEFSLATPMLYLDPKENHGLMIEPRLDGRSIGIGQIEEKLPLHVRARRARLVTKGLLVFDDGEVTSSRASDAVQLRFQSLTVEEYNPDKEDDGTENPHVVGFGSDSSQWFSGRRLQVRAERVPLFWTPRVDFGQSEITDAIAQPLRSLRTGNRSEVGRFLFLTIGGSLGRDKRNPLLNWTLTGGGYSKRGPAIGPGLNWDHSGSASAVRSKGYLDTIFVWDHRSFDSNDFVADEKPRWRVLSEARTNLSAGEELYLDTSLSYFSDRGFNNEFFERDDLQHRDRDSYAHLRWLPKRPGNLVATLDGKWHARNFETETTEMPEAGLWVFPVPLLKPRSRGGFELDLTSTNKAGYLGRRYDNLLPETDYEAWRFLSDTVVNAAADVGDVRVSGWAGASAAAYTGRTDGGDDLTRTALLAGVRANLQLHRVYNTSGSWFRLNGLRHIVDVDVGGAGRFRDSAGPAEVPQFDLRDAVRQRSAATVRVRNRFQTRREAPKARLNSEERLLLGRQSRTSTGLRTVADLEVALNTYLDDKGPYLRDSPGSVAVTLFGEPREQLNIAGETLIDLEAGLQTGSVGLGLTSLLREKPFAVFVGYRYVKSRSTSISADLAWRFSDKYAVRLLEVVDFREGEDLTRLVFRRYSDDHIIVFGVNVRNREEVDFVLSLEAAIGGRTTEGPRAFKDRPDPNPWGAFR